MYTQFREASNILLKPHEANIYLYFIERSVNKAIIQHQRIQHDKLNHSTSTPIQSVETSTIMLADIHYYLVNWTEFYRYYETLNKFQPLFVLPEELVESFKLHRYARNFIEHRNEKIKPNNDLGNFHSDIFTYDDYSIALGNNDLDDLKKSYLTILKIALENFDLYQPRTFFEVFMKYGSHLF
jgi:hypothetical protein